MRGATKLVCVAFHTDIISIHAPLAGCDQKAALAVRQLDISIHAPLAGCDFFSPQLFQSFRISIHAPLAGCDRVRAWARWGCAYFNPRAPCGVRLALACGEEGRTTHFNPRAPCGVRQVLANLVGAKLGFQSTRPLRGATVSRTPKQKKEAISIHAPLAGCDERLKGLSPDDLVISIHAPLAGCDCPCVVFGRPCLDFNPRAPCGVRRPTTYSINQSP